MDEVDAICDAALALEGDGSPGSALLRWLEQGAAFFISKRPVGAELLKNSNHGNTFFSANRDRVLAAGRPLLTEAQRAHEVRADLTIEQVLDMVSAITTIHGDPGYLQPILQTALQGLRAPDQDVETS